MTNGEINLGRWMTPDKLGGDVLNPQSLNRYAYALNSPATNIDPMGTDSMNFGGYVINGLPDGEVGWNGEGVYATNSCACAAASFEAAAPAGDASCSEPPFGPGYPPYPGGFGGGGAGYNPPAPPPPPPAGQPPMEGGGLGDPWVSSTTTVPGLYCASYGGVVFRAPGDGTMPCFRIFVSIGLPLGQGYHSVQKPPPPSPVHTGSYWNYLGCVASEGILLGFGNSDRAYATLGLNVAAVALSEVPFVNVAAAGIATFYDLKLEFEIRETCMEEVYGHP